MRLSLHFGIAALIVLIQLTSTSSGNAIYARLMSLFFGDDDEKELIRPMIQTTRNYYPWYLEPITRKPLHHKTTTKKQRGIVTTTTKKPTTTTTRHPIIVIASPNREDRECGIFPDARQPSRHRRVVGGYEAPRGFHPYIASIRYLWAWQCGATIIHPKYILTAAHCVDDSTNPKDFDVKVGVWDRSEHEGTQQRRTHILSTTTSPYYTPVTLTKDVGLACIPSRDFSYYHGRLCLIHGWGKTGSSRFSMSDRQRAGVVPLIDKKTCTNSTSYSFRSLTDTVFCAGYSQGGVDSCQGDSGGPLVCQESDGVYTVAGVTSWGDGCAQKNSPGVYTKVSSYLGWIDRILKTGNHRRSVSVSSEDDYDD